MVVNKTRNQKKRYTRKKLGKKKKPGKKRYTQKRLGKKKKYSKKRMRGGSSLNNTLESIDAMVGDSDFMLKSVKHNGVTALEYASDELKNNSDFMLKAIKLDPRALGYASPTLQNDLEFVKEAIKRNKDAFNFVSPTLQKDLDLWDAHPMNNAKGSSKNTIFDGNEY